MTLLYIITQQKIGEKNKEFKRKKKILDKKAWRRWLERRDFNQKSTKVTSNC